jgi:hypothetical protein
MRFLIIILFSTLFFACNSGDKHESSSSILQDSLASEIASLKTTNKEVFDSLQTEYESQNNKDTIKLSYRLAQGVNQATKEFLDTLNIYSSIHLNNSLKYKPATGMKNIFYVRKLFIDYCNIMSTIPREGKAKRLKTKELILENNELLLIQLGRGRIPYAANDFLVDISRIRLATLKIQLLINRILFDQWKRRIPITIKKSKNNH